MEAILKFNLSEDQAEFQMAMDAGKMHNVLWEMDQWLRSQYKYMPDEFYSKDRYDTYVEARDKLHELMVGEGVKLD